jgi:transposase
VPAQLVNRVKAAIESSSSDQAVFGVMTMEEMIADSLTKPRFHVFRMGAFALLAVAMAAAGMYSVISFLVSERTGEIAIRIALGASRGAIVKTVLGTMSLWVVAGLAGGLALGLAASITLRSLTNTEVAGDVRRSGSVLSGGDARGGLHARTHCVAAGHPSLQLLSRGTVSKILRAHAVQPHKIRYYLEQRDPQFESKMKQVLHVYKQIELWHEVGAPSELIAVLSYDEKPGIQAIENTAPDLPPVPGQYAGLGRDHEYIRHGTLSLLAGIDLWNGEVLGLVRERHRSAEFIEFLRLAHAHYPAPARIRMVLDNHSAHISRETRAYLATVPNRFEFIFTPTHGSWLNLIESFFGKMAKTLLRGIRVKSKEELKTRIEIYLREVNEEPVVFRWKYKLETLSVV